MTADTFAVNQEKLMKTEAVVDCINEFLLVRCLLRLPHADFIELTNHERRNATFDTFTSQKPQ